MNKTVFHVHRLASLTPVALLGCLLAVPGLASAADAPIAPAAPTVAAPAVPAPDANPAVPAPARGGRAGGAAAPFVRIEPLANAVEVELTPARPGTRQLQEQAQDDLGGCEALR